MTITTHTTDRKALAKAIAEELGTTAKYMGVPGCGYQIGDYIVDREGNINGEDFEALRPFLQRNGFLPEDEAAPAEEQTEPETKTPDSGAIDQVSVSVPADDLTPAQLKNLIFTLYTKQYLIGKMTGGDLLNIPDTLIARLMENTPESMEDFKALLDAAKDDGLTGVDLEEGKGILH